MPVPPAVTTGATGDARVKSLIPADLFPSIAGYLKGVTVTAGTAATPGVAARPARALKLSARTDVQIALELHADAAVL